MQEFRQLKNEIRGSMQYLAVGIDIAKEHHFMRYFTKKLTGRERERGIKTKMRVKLSAKMLVIAWTLMKKKETFDPECIGE